MPSSLGAANSGKDCVKAKSGCISEKEQRDNFTSRLLIRKLTPLILSANERTTLLIIYVRYQKNDPTRSVIIEVTIFVNKQLDAQFFLMDVYFYSPYVSDTYVSIIRRFNCIITTSRHLVYVNLRRWPPGMQVWNQQVQTERTIPNNKLDIIIRDKDKGTHMLVDSAITGEINVIRERSRKYSKI